MQVESVSNDLLTSEDYYVRAATGKRLANYLIDFTLFYILLFGIGILLAFIAPSSIDAISNFSDNNGFADRVLTLVLYALYMSAIEAAFKGKSLGKLITRTRALNLDGSQISVSTAFSRGFSRAVPFCVFSAFGTPCVPWQDRWTNTMVIDEKQSQVY